MTLSLTRKNAKEKTVPEIVQVMDPTSMTDATASKFGQKMYRHGVAGYLGNLPNVTPGTGGGTLTSAEFWTWQMNDGLWILEGELVVGSTSSTSSFTFTINSVTSSAINADWWPVQASSLSASVGLGYARIGSGATTFEIVFAGNVTNYIARFKIALAARPNWVFI